MYYCALIGARRSTCLMTVRLSLLRARLRSVTPNVSKRPGALLRAAMLQRCRVWQIEERDTCLAAKGLDA